MAKKIKCGEYLYKDGVVIKRPGKKFRAPSLPKKLQIQYPDNDSSFPRVPTTGERYYDDIGQMNYMKEIAFQKKYRDLHSHLRKLYYIGQLVAGIKKLCCRLAGRKLPMETVMDMVTRGTERQRRE